MSKGAQIAGGATVIALLLGWYAASNLEPGAAFRYFKQLDEFLAHAAEHEGKHTRVHGYVALESIDRDLEAKQVRFSIQNDPPHAAGVAERQLEVIFTSLETPDLFKDGAEVVVEGRFTAAASGGVFHADRVLAKCPSKFEADAAQTVSF